MARRRESGIETLASMHWPAGVIFGVVAFVVIDDGIGWVFGSNPNPYLAAFGKAAADGSFHPFAWMAMLTCWFAALISFFRRKRRQRLPETQTGLDSLRAMDWKAFELLVGEAFRRQGYTVVETGQGGADGGFDLVLHKNGSLALVQCKQWRKRQVTVNVVREMFGLLAHYHADAVIIVSCGDYTADARHFAHDKPMALITGNDLLAMVRAVQTAPSPSPELEMSHAASASGTEPTIDANAPTCPTCGAAMVHRKNRRTQARFWGCATYPSCRGTRIISAS